MMTKRKSVACGQNSRWRGKDAPPWHAPGNLRVATEKKANTTSTLERTSTHEWTDGHIERQTGNGSKSIRRYMHPLAPHEISFCENGFVLLRCPAATHAHSQAVRAC